MAEDIRKPTKEETEASAGPAQFANRFFITMTPSGARLAFAEQLETDGKSYFRNAVVLPYQDAIELVRVLGTLIKPIEEQIKAAAAQGLPHG